MTAVAAVGGAVGLHRLQHVRMVPHDHRSPGIEHLVRQCPRLQVAARVHIRSPVNGDHQHVALRRGAFIAASTCASSAPGAPPDSPWIGEEVHMRLVVLVGIAVAVEPAGHAQPANLDPVGLDDRRGCQVCPAVSPEPTKCKSDFAADVREFPRNRPNPGPSRGCWQTKRS